MENYVIFFTHPIAIPNLYAFLWSVDEFEKCWEPNNIVAHCLPLAVSESLGCWLVALLPYQAMT